MKFPIYFRLYPKVISNPVHVQCFWRKANSLLFAYIKLSKHGRNIPYSPRNIQNLLFEIYIANFIYFHPPLLHRRLVSYFIVRGPSI